jgi:hypothetical protein
MLKTDPKRWHRPEAYLKSWSSRGEALINLIDATLPDHLQMEFSEYGCGPNAPVSSILSRTNRRCDRLDLKAWDPGCMVVDLNGSELLSLPTDVAVLSGVVEYLSEFPRALRLLSSKHRYLLFSYYCLSDLAHLFPSRSLREVNKRAVQSGWRNHYSFNALLGCLSGVAFVVSAKKFGRQSLVLCEFIQKD